MSDLRARFIQMLDAPLDYSLEDFLRDIHNANAFAADCSGMDPDKHLTLVENDGSEMRITIKDHPFVWFTEYFHRHYKSSDEGMARAFAVSSILSFIQNHQAWLEDVGLVDPARGVSTGLYRELLKIAPSEIGFRPKKIVRRLKALLREESP